MIYFIAVILFIGALFLVGGDETANAILLNDINVGDKINIKGEMFIVKAYSPEGNMEIVNSKNGESYIIKIDDSTKLTSHSDNGIRKYISIDNFDGTVGGEYLNRFKFK
jgi:hypothetical protein